MSKAFFSPVEAAIRHNIAAIISDTCSFNWHPIKIWYFMCASFERSSKHSLDILLSMWSIFVYKLQDETNPRALLVRVMICLKTLSRIWCITTYLKFVFINNREKALSKLYWTAHLSLLFPLSLWCAGDGGNGGGDGQTAISTAWGRDKKGQQFGSIKQASTTRTTNSHQLFSSEHSHNQHFLLLVS